jgi:putative transposase
MRTDFATQNDMPRPPRIFEPGISVHVIQRGHNRMAIFRHHADYEWYLTFISEAAEQTGVLVHAFTLMSNHTHAIVTPERREALPRMMKIAGGKYTNYFNKSYTQIGSVWNGRYRALLINDERYWLTCLRYVEQNPVRANIVKEPGAYRWSSYAAHAFGDGPTWLSPHRLYLALGKTPAERQAAYRTICRENVEPVEASAIRRTNAHPETASVLS